MLVMNLSTKYCRASYSAVAEEEMVWEGPAASAHCRKRWDAAAGVMLVMVVSLIGLVQPVQGAVSYIVGDNRGWDFPPANYSSPDGSWYSVEWARAYTFYVGDSLVFRYSTSVHEVVEVYNSGAYNICDFTSPPTQTHRLGNDTILLDAPGWHFYMCPYHDHCKTYNLKMKIWVADRVAKSSVVGPIAGAIGGVVFLLLLLVGVSFMVWRRKRRARQMITSKPKIPSGMATMFSLDMDAPRRFSYKELSAATKGFSPALLLGHGGFGSVYKGTLRDDKRSVVAVKQIAEDSKQGETEFVAEVSIIGRIRHRNLVRLHGWCAEKGKLLVVYDYMPNGSLDKLLLPEDGQPSSQNKLAWNMRYNILSGVAAALAYLHEEWQQCVLHRDIKPSNVLLDAKFNAYLGDFGMARLVEHNKLAHSTVVAGTMGYLAPELPYTHKATTKTDVFSFGVLALETACGRRAFNPRLPHEEVYLLDWVWSMHQSDHLLEALDPRLEADPNFDVMQSKLVLHLGLICCHPDPTSRPDMRYIRRVLEGECTLPDLPPSKPTISYSWSSTMKQSRESISIEHFEGTSVDSESLPI